MSLAGCGRALLPFVLISVLLVVGCDAWTHIRGTVRDETGKPIRDAIITMKVSEKSNKTTSYEDGRYAITMNTSSPWRMDVLLTVSKEGYRSCEKHLKSNGRFDNFDVVLERVK